MQCLKKKKVDFCSLGPEEIQHRSVYIKKKILMEEITPEAIMS